MEHSQNFISLSYNNIDFLLQKDAVDTVFSCTSEDIYEDDNKSKKINFLSQSLFCIDFDKYAMNLHQNIQEVNTKKSIILNSSKIFEGQNQLALITSADCRVKQIDYKDFSFFSDFYSESLSKKGILACSFNEKNYVCYLLDIEAFFKKVEK